MSKHPAPAMGARLTVFWAILPYGSAGRLALLLIKAGDVETNPGPTSTHKQVWICDICYKQIHDRKRISIRFNRIEHWVHLRCAGIRPAQYTDTWACHLHKETGLTTHTDITSSPPLQSQVQAHSPLPTYTTHTTATQTQTHVQHSPCSHRISKAQSSHTLTPFHLYKRKQSHTKSEQNNLHSVHTRP